MKKESFFSFFIKRWIVLLIIVVISGGVATYIIQKNILEQELQDNVTNAYTLFNDIELGVVIELSDASEREIETAKNNVLYYMADKKPGSVLVNADTGEIVAPLKDQVIVKALDNICASCPVTYFEGIDYRGDYYFFANDFYLRDTSFLPGNVEVYKYDSETGLKLVETVDLTPADTEGYEHFTKHKGVLQFSLVNEYPKDILQEKVPSEFHQFNQSEASGNVYYKADKGFLKYACYEYTYKGIDGETYSLIYENKIDIWAIGKQFFLFTYFGLFVAGMLIAGIAALLDHKRYEKMRYQRTLTSSLAHDLKSPLMVISGYVENITENICPDKNADYIQAIGQNVKYMNDIISNITELNTLQENRSGLAKEKQNLASIFHNILERNQSYMTKRQVKAEVTGDAEVKCNRDSLTRALDNLLQNAIANSPAGETIKVKISNQEIVIRNLHENKITCKPEQLFDPFVKGDDSRGSTGTGLGLSIAKTIMDMHKFGMEIKLEDNVFEVKIKL